MWAVLAVAACFAGQAYLLYNLLKADAFLDQADGIGGSLTRRDGDAQRENEGGYFG